MRDSIYFLIKGGRALELVQARIAEVIRVRSGVRALAEELGIREGGTDSMTGTLSYVIFPDPSTAPADFKKPDRRGRSYPKKGTAWATKLKAQVGYESAESVIANGLGVPTCLHWTSPNGWGSRNLGILDSCGFLFLSADGPYAMWVPDVPKEIEKLVKENPDAVVGEPARSFKLEFEGCTRIEKERWEIMVLEHELKGKLLA